jgi:hypothetical protein
MEFSTRHRRDHLFCRTPLARALRFETLEDRRVMAVLTVDTPLDVVNLNDGLTSLREAIFAANIVPGADEIVFDISTRAATITLSQGELKITDSLKITGPGVNLLMIDASGSDPTPSDKKGDGSRVFNVSNGTDSVIDVEISGLYITGGDTQNLGGGISNSENLVIRNALIQGNYSINGGGIHSRGRLEVIDSIVSGNTARTGSGRDPYGGYGGGINASQLVLINSTVNQNTGRLGAGIAGGNIEIRRSEVFLNDGDGIDVSGELRIVDSTIAANKSRGIFAHMATGTISNSTISGNEAGGLFAIGGNLEIEHSTITGNAMRAGMGGGIESVGFAGAMRVHSSIIAGNIGRDVAAQTSSIVSEGYNLIGVGTAVGAFNQAGDQTGVTDPLLGPLANNGGPTRNHALLPGSPAINAGEPTLVGGENGVPEFDQRGGPFTRVFGGRIDIGAFEAQSLIVDTLLDENDDDYSAGDFSLREAIDLANRIVGENTIEFASSLSGGTILLTMGELKITDHVQIVGLGADRLTVDARWMSRVIYVDGVMGTTAVPGAVDVVIQGITLTNGVAPNDFSLPTYSRSRGAGICFISSGHLNLDGVIVKGNRAFGNSNAAGAGVYVTRGITTITNSQFIENRCVDANNRPSRGAGISSDNAVFIADSVFSNNIGNAIHVIQNFGNTPIDVLLTRTEISSNNGMALMAEGLRVGSVQVVQSTINKNSMGGILAWNGHLKVTDSFVTNNGGAVGASSGLSTGGDITVVRSTVSGNIAESGGGLWGGGHIAVTDSFITNNHSLVSDLRYGGGGILQSGRSQTLTITNSVISNNTSAGHGGGIHTSGQAIILDSVISGNHAAYQGGGIFGGESSDITLMRSTVDGNTAVGFRSTGAGIYSHGDVTVKYSTISNNRGTGIQATFGGMVAKEVSLLNATISGNGRGGIRASTIDARHSTITRNTGTGLYAQNISLDHTIVAGNIFSNQYESDVSTPNLQARYSQISIGAEYLEPLRYFGGPTRIHELISGSPAINAGDPNLQPGKNGVPEFDQRGAPYTRATNRIDIGAYEYQSAILLNGDFDLDGDIDGRDLLIWQRNFGAVGVNKDSGDATGDNDVDGNDLAVWQATYGPPPRPRFVDLLLTDDDAAAVQLVQYTGATVVLSSSAMSDVDAAFDDWPVQRRASADFGEMATRRKSLRTPRR